MSMMQRFIQGVETTKANLLHLQIQYDAAVSDLSRLQAAGGEGRVTYTPVGSNDPIVLFADADGQASQYLQKLAEDRVNNTVRVMRAEWSQLRAITQDAIKYIEEATHQAGYRDADENGNVVVQQPTAPVPPAGPSQVVLQQTTPVLPGVLSAVPPRVRRVHQE